MTKIKTSIAALFLTSTMMTTIHAADITISTAGQTGVPKVYISGEINSGDEKKFAQILLYTANNARTFLYLDSIGGDLSAGLAIAYKVRENPRIETVVYNNRCASMCALIWLASNVRWATSDSRVGFHAMQFTEAKDNCSVSPGGNAVIGAFLARGGFSDTTIRRLTETEPKSMFWLTTAKAKELGIEAKTITTRQ